MQSHSTILADGRWNGPHGIGRFSVEVLHRLQHTDILTEGPRPLSAQNLLWNPYALYKRQQYKVFFNPGFNPLLYSPIPFVFTICDLTHLQYPGSHPLLKKMYYRTLIKSAIKRARMICTISNFSKQEIITWSGVPDSHVVNVSCGISQHLTQDGPRYVSDYPYLLHVGNHEKPHKNSLRLLQAFAAAKIDPAIRLLFTGTASRELEEMIRSHHLTHRILFQGIVSEAELAALYRGALAVVFPSLCEGFGLPPLEAMACGTPVVVSNAASLPEVCGNAAVYVEPLAIDSIATGIERIIDDNTLRHTLIAAGIKQASRFTWENTAANVQQVLDHIAC